jgi:hypothetical protein
MTRKILYLFFFMLLSNYALASENYIKIHYQPSRNISDRVMDITINASFQNDDLIADTYQKLKQMKMAGRLEYYVPDAPSIAIEVKYNDEIIKAANTPGVEKLDEFLSFQKSWDEVYVPIWKTINERLPKP